jgi:hypothetical protein
MVYRATPIQGAIANLSRRLPPLVDRLQGANASASLAFGEVTPWHGAGN